MLTCELNGNVINTFDSGYSKEQLKTWSKKGILKCPICKREYEYCHGKVKIPYFRHKDKVECEYDYAEPETLEHLKGKRDLYEFLSKQENVYDLVLEGWLPETKQRPDIMFKIGSKQYVLEYQCTPISTEYHERHDLYKAANIIDIWVCGTDKYLNKKNSSKSFRLKEIQKNTDYYYDSDIKTFIIAKCGLANILTDNIKTSSYETGKFLDCDMSQSYFGNISYALLLKEKYVKINDGKIVCNEECIKRINKINELKNKEIITRNTILKYAKEYLLNMYNIEFYDDVYDLYAITVSDGDRFCFKIDIENKKYRCIRKSFVRNRKTRSGWECVQDTVSVNEYDVLKWSSFISFVISNILNESYCLKEKIKTIC